MPRGVTRSMPSSAVCAFPGCGKPFVPSQAKQRYCRGSCRAKDSQRRNAVRLMPIDDIVALLDQLKAELVRRAAMYEGRGGG